MSKVRVEMAMSLDGFTSAPNQRLDQPFGDGGMRVMGWALETDFFARMQGRDEPGERNASNDVLERSFTNLGATVMGRNMFGGYPGDWSSDEPWNGWWGEEPPFHHPVFVVTHYAREPLTLGDTTFHFVTDGVESAVRQAREAAGDADVKVAGGATVARQALAAGVVDELWINQAHVLLGAGERLLDELGDPLPELSLIDQIVAPKATHLRFTVG